LFIIFPLYLMSFIPHPRREINKAEVGINALTVIG